MNNFDFIYVLLVFKVIIIFGTEPLQLTELPLFPCKGFLCYMCPDMLMASYVLGFLYPDGDFACFSFVTGLKQFVFSCILLVEI